MDKKIIAAISLCALFFSLMLVGSSVKFGLSNDYHIHNINTGIDYFTIQEAINAAETLNGHVILVDAGIYYESAVVNKTLTIIGDNAETVIIDGEDNAAYMFQVIAKDVVIENFTLRNTDPDPYHNSPAVRVYNVTNVAVKNIIITDVVMGIEVRDANFTKITHNKIYESITYGVYIHGASYNNTIVGNSFERNPTAVRFDGESGFSSVYNNNFVNNTNHVVSLAINYFDAGYPVGGNYWSDYGGKDDFSGPNQNEPGSDGIGDASHYVYGTIQDYYPLMGVFSDFPVTSDAKDYHVTVVSNSTLSAFGFSSMNRTIEFNVSSVGSVGFCRVCVPHGLVFPPINVTVDYGLTEVLYFDGSLYDDGALRWVYFVYSNSEHVVTIQSVASIQIESPTELSPACTHSETNVTVAYVYTEENPLNVTIEFYNVTNVVGSLIITGA